MATDTVFIYTMNKGAGAQSGAWTRYVFPWTIEHFAHLENTLYMRHEDDISYAIIDALDDDGVDFDGVIQWPWLDFGQPGVNKMLEGFDIVGTGTSSIEYGFDQTAIADFTASYPIPADTFPGQLIPTPLQFPSLSVKLTYDGGQDWQWNALNLYLEDQRIVV